MSATARCPSLELNLTVPFQLADTFYTTKFIYARRAAPEILEELTTKCDLSSLLSGIEARAYRAVCTTQWIWRRAA